MPELSRFYGIVIKMYAEDHPRPHFPAEYAEWKATFMIDTLELDYGFMPKTAVRMVKQWAQIHQTELLNDWELLRAGKTPRKIKPLE